jgi:hypothetical protein
VKKLRISRPSERPKAIFLHILSRQSSDVRDYQRKFVRAGETRKQDSGNLSQIENKEPDIQERKKQASH